MFLDASAIVAICAGEEDAGYLIGKIETAKKPIYYSSLAMFEAVISLARIVSISIHGDQELTPPHLIDQAQQDVDRFIETIGAKEMSVNGTMHRSAIQAARTFGRLVAHPARLNFGDCFSYACAKDFRLPLLYEGNDFSQTDIESA